MSKALRIVFGVLGAILLALLIGPFVVPIPPLVDTVAPEKLADPDSLFTEVNGVRVHYKRVGQGQPVFVLLHGFAASVFSWHPVLQGLSQFGTVIAFDRPAFGLTERPRQWPGQNPYTAEFAADLTVGLLDQLGVERAILVGHSAGGAIAVLTAVRHPERVQGLVLEDAAIYNTGGSGGFLGFLMHTPQGRRLGPLFVRSIAKWGDAVLEQAWHDPSLFTAEDRAGYHRPLQAENWDGALWEFTLAAHPLDLENRLDAIGVPTLVLTGDDDRIVPTEQSVRLAGEIPGAQLVTVAACGHIPHEERPSAFMQAVELFLEKVR